MRERLASFDAVFGDLAGSRKVVDFVLHHVRNVTAWIEPDESPTKLFVGFREVANLLKTSSKQETATTQRVIKVLDNVVEDYVPADLGRLIGTFATGAAADQASGWLREYERQLMYFGAPSAADMARLRFGVSF